MWAQPVEDDLGAWRDTVALAEPQPHVLRPFIIPGSERLYFEGARLDTSRYRLDYRHGRLWVDPLSARSTATLIAVYRTYPFTFREAYRRRGVERAEVDTAGAVTVVEEERVDEAFDPFGGVHLQRSGSITRGISAGNNRDVTVESGLRMQVSGEVADGVEVQAVLTDENTPILPEGTTQRLSEFDRVFIEVAAAPGTAQLGDFDLHFGQGEFARITRKLQGVTVFGDVPDPQTAVLGGGRVAVAGATARGIYRTQDIAVQEGVQGPYRLEGLGGEQFIIVVPGSETVYLNGQPLTRGESNDYVIDYATGELTFTSNRLITEESRVTVEFQYSANQFTRTLLAAQGDAALWQRRDGTPRARFGATVVREADSRQLGEEFGLTPADSALLAQAGDDRAVRSGAERVEFDPEAPYVQYTQEVVGADTIFVPLDAAPAPDTPVYRVRFTRVGEGQGTYARVGRAANGIRYEYRGAGGGAYAPIRVLPQPEQQRVIDLRGSLEPLPGIELYGEWANSLNDENRFSSLDAADDRGLAYLAGARLRPLDLTIADRDLGRLAVTVRRRFAGDDFAAFDRIRPVEFARRWNLGLSGLSSDGSTVQPYDEVTDEAALAFAFTEQSRLEGEVGRIRLGDGFRGARQEVRFRLGEPGLPRLGYRLEMIQSTDSLQTGTRVSPSEDGRWLRHLLDIEQPLLDRRLVPRLEVEQERRRQRVLGTDSLTTGSLAFVEVRPGLGWRTERLQVGGQMELRMEDLPAGGDLRDASRAWTLRSEVAYRPGEAFKASGSAGYRIRRFTDYFRVQQRREDTESRVLQSDGSYRPWQRALDLSWFYEAQTERTPTLQEIYVRTGPELGQFVWIDGSGDTPEDGIIQLDEFLPERTPDEGTYVRTFVPSDSLTSIINVQTRLRLDLDPSRLWRRSDTRWRRWLAQVSSRTTFEVTEKSRSPDLAPIYLLDLSRFRDTTSTLNGRLRVGQDLTLFRTKPRYGIDLSFSQVRALSELAAGEETRFINTWRFDGRYRPAQRWGTRVRAAWEHNRTGSEQFRSRRYDIEGLTVEPEVSFNPLRSLQLTTSVSYARKIDGIGDRSAQVLKVPVEARLTRVSRLQLSGRFEVAGVQLDGEATGLAQFELTDGRGPGTSYLWSLNGQYRFTRLLRASLAYNGRAPADAPVLHTVRLQLSATF